MSSNTLVYDGTANALSLRFSHSPFVVRFSDRELIIIFARGTGEGSSDFHAACTRSTDNGQTWSTPVKISPEFGTDAFYGGLVFVSPSDPNRIEAWGATKNVAGTSARIFRICSNDRGVTWGELQRLDMGNGAALQYPPLHPPVVLPDGRWAMAIYHRVASNSIPGVAVCRFNPDLTGITTSAAVTAGGSYGALEPSMTLDANGTTLRIFCRTDTDHVINFVSLDGGATIVPTPGTPSLVTTSSKTLVQRRLDGKHLVAYNRNPIRRDNLCLAQFSDGTLTTCERLFDIARSPQYQQQVGYPAFFVDAARNVDYVWTNIALLAVPTAYGKIYYRRILAGELETAVASPMRSYWLPPRTCPPGFTPVGVDVGFTTARPTFHRVMPGPTKVWAVGLYGAMVSSTDNGRTWVPLVHAADGRWNDGVMRSDLIGVVACQEDDFAGITADGWVTAAVTVGTGALVYSVGISGTTYIWGTKDGKIRTSTDVVTFTTRYDSGVADRIYRAVATSTNFVWVVGDSGSVVKASTGALTSWSTVAAGATQDLYAVCALGATIIIVGDNGELLVSFDEGTSWKRSVLSSGAWKLNGVSVNSDGNAIIVSDAGYIWESEDAALATWSVGQRVGGLESYLSVGHAPNNVPIVVGGDGLLLTR